MANSDLVVNSHQIFSVINETWNPVAEVTEEVAKQTDKGQILTNCSLEERRKQVKHARGKHSIRICCQVVLLEVCYLSKTCCVCAAFSNYHKVYLGWCQEHCANLEVKKAAIKAQFSNTVSVSLSCKMSSRTEFFRHDQTQCVEVPAEALQFKQRWKLMIHLCFMWWEFHTVQNFTFQQGYAVQLHTDNFFVWSQITSYSSSVMSTASLFFHTCATAWMLITSNTSVWFKAL